MTDLPSDFSHLTLDYSQCRHEATWKAGRTEDDRQKWRCGKCGRSWTDGVRDVFDLKVQAGKKLLEQGQTPYDVEKQGLLSWTTAKKVADAMGSGSRPPCPCGKPANHRYGCWYRRQKAALTDCKHGKKCKCAGK